MPRGNGTGPMGYGPMTGRGAGYCAGYATPGYANSGFGMGRGQGFGRGSGRGFGRMNWAGYGYSINAPYQGYPENMGTYQPPVYDEKEVLENQVASLEKQLEQMRNRLKDFEEKE